MDSPQLQSDLDDFDQESSIQSNNSYIEASNDFFEEEQFKQKPKQNKFEMSLDKLESEELDKPFPLQSEANNLNNDLAPLKVQSIDSLGKKPTLNTEPGSRKGDFDDSFEEDQAARETITRDYLDKGVTDHQDNFGLFNNYKKDLPKFPDLPDFGLSQRSSKPENIYSFPEIGLPKKSQELPEQKFQEFNVRVKSGKKTAEQNTFVQKMERSDSFEELTRQQELESKKIQDIVMGRNISQRNHSNKSLEPSVEKKLNNYKASERKLPRKTSNKQILLKNLQQQNDKLRNQLKELNDQINNVIEQQRQKIVPKQSEETVSRARSEQYQTAVKQIDIYTKERDKLANRVETLNDPSYIFNLKQKIQKQKDYLKKVQKQNHDLNQKQRVNGNKITRYYYQKEPTDNLKRFSDYSQELAILKQKVQELEGNIEKANEMYEAQYDQECELQEKYEKLLEIAMHYGSSLSQNTRKNAKKQQIQEEHAKVSKQLNAENRKIQSLLTKYKLQEADIQKQISIQNNLSLNLDKQLKIKQKEIDLLQQELTNAIDRAHGRGMDSILDSLKPKQAKAQSAQNTQKTRKPEKFKSTPPKEATKKSLFSTPRLNLVESQPPNLQPIADQKQQIQEKIEKPVERKPDKNKPFSSNLFKMEPSAQIPPPPPIQNNPPPIQNNPPPILNNPPPILNNPPPILNHQTPIQNHQTPIQNHQTPILNYPAPIMASPSTGFSPAPQVDQKASFLSQLDYRTQQRQQEIQGQNNSFVQDNKYSIPMKLNTHIPNQTEQQPIRNNSFAPNIPSTYRSDEAHNNKSGRDRSHLFEQQKDDIFTKPPIYNQPILVEETKRDRRAVEQELAEKAQSGFFFDDLEEKPKIEQKFDLKPMSFDLKPQQPQIQQQTAQNYKPAVLNDLSDLEEEIIL